MIEFHYELDFKLADESKHIIWIEEVLKSEEAEMSQLDYIFCTDEFLLAKNKQFLNHDTLTDIITFDYSARRCISGDIFISIERVRENSQKYNVRFEIELLRVMAHGVLHLLGFKDKTKEESTIMRAKENEKIKLFHVEQ